MSDFLDVTAHIGGNKFRFNCPHCSSSHVWSAEQVMSMPDAWIADHCGKCGNGFRVWKPSDALPEAFVPPPTFDEPAPTPARGSAIDSKKIAGPQGISPNYRYKVVPFIGRSKGDLSAGGVASQLEATIQQYANAGWEFQQLGDVNIEVQPGCVAGLFGATVQYIRFDQIIFRQRI